MNQMHRLLLVDDHPKALKLLTRLAEKLGYRYDTAEDGQQAYDQVAQNAVGHYSAVITDRMMPHMDGMALLEAVHQLPGQEHLPVIMQTALTGDESMQEGIEAGAFYYLPKPLNLKLVEKVIAAAVADFKTHQSLISELSRLEDSLGLLVSARFHYRTLEEATHLAATVSAMTDQPQSAVVALYELMVNAVEHGNLGITYQEKSALLQSGQWQQEVQKRLQSPPFAQRHVTVEVTRQAGQVVVVMTDQGDGFDYENYLSFSAERMMDTHGRGIMMAHAMGGASVTYAQGGREVTCTFAVQGQDT